MTSDGHAGSAMTVSAMREQAVQFGCPGRAQPGVGGGEGGRFQGAGQPPPQCRGGQLVGQRPVAVDRVGQQCGHVGAGAGGRLEVGGQPRPERVGADVGVDALGEAAPALGAGLAAAQRSVDAVVDELLDGRRAVGVLFGAGDAGVGDIDVVGGAEHRDLGHQLGLLSQQGARPGRGGTGLPLARGGADLVGQVADELGARVQVGAPLGVCGQRVGGGRQPAQRTDPLGARPVRWLEPPVEHRGDVDGVSHGGGGGGV